MGYVVGVRLMEYRNDKTQEYFTEYAYLLSGPEQVSEWIRESLLKEIKVLCD